MHSKIFCVASVFLLSLTGFAAPEEDALYERVTSLITANNKLLDRVVKTVEKEKPGSAVFDRLQKDLDLAIPETGRTVQDARKAVYSLRAQVIGLDQKHFGDLGLLYDQRKTLQKELAIHDRAVAEARKQTDVLVAAAKSPASAKRIQSLWDGQQASRDKARAPMVSGLTAVQDQINSIVRPTGRALTSLDDFTRALLVSAAKLDGQADKLENKLWVLEDQFQSAETGLNAYRVRLQDAGVRPARQAPDSH